MMTNAVISTTHRGEAREGGSGGEGLGGGGGGGTRAQVCTAGSSTFVEEKLNFPKLGNHQRQEGRHLSSITASVVCPVVGLVLVCSISHRHRSLS